jgi:serine/threonine protein kinase
MARKLSLATQVTDAVWHAHQRGVAHLDLKPQNILLSSSEDGSGPVAKVADWGLSKMLLENSASVEGLSPQYSAPEQFDADEHGSPDNKTDILRTVRRSTSVRGVGYSGDTWYPERFAGPSAGTRPGPSREDR